MPVREDSAALVMQALATEPRPISSTRVIEVAYSTLPRPLAAQFEKWFGPNGARLLERLNA